MPDAQALWEQLKNLLALVDILTGLPHHKRNNEEKVAWWKEELGVEVSYWDLSRASSLS